MPQQRLMPQRFACDRRVLRLAAGLLLVLIGTAAGPYEFGNFPQWHDGAASPSDVTIEYGRPSKTLDRIGQVVGFPARILPMNKKINNHHISPETLDKLKSYLVRNDLADVCVYVNDYDPKGQWRRLKANRQISPGWRYSVGILSLAGYTLLPGRIFGGDAYNPYTNTLSLHSDVPAMVLREAAWAKCVHAHRLPGTYTVVSSLPLVSLWPSGQTAREVFAYARLEHDWETEREAYKVLCPQFGATVLSAGTPFVGAWWAGPALSVGGALAGHATGHVLAARRGKQIEAEAANDEGVQLATHLEPLEPMPALACPWLDEGSGTWRELGWDDENDGKSFRPCVQLCNTRPNE